MGHRSSHSPRASLVRAGQERWSSKAWACRFATPLARPRARQVGRSEENRRAISLPASVPTRRPKHPGPGSSVSLRGGAKRHETLAGSGNEAWVSSPRFLGFGDTRVLRSPHEEGQVPSTARPSSTSFARWVLTRAALSVRRRAPLSSRRPSQADAPGSERGLRPPRGECRGGCQKARLFDLHVHLVRGAWGPASRHRVSGTSRRGTRTEATASRGRGSTARERARASYVKLQISVVPSWPREAWVRRRSQRR